MGAIVKGMQNTTKDPYNIKFIRKVNEPATVDFTILKTENEENANYKIGEVIAFKDLTFVVDKAEEVDDGNGIVTLEVALVQNCINLSRVYATPKVYTSTQFYTIARELLSGTGWSLGDDDLSASLVLDFEIKEEQTVMNALIGLVEKVGAVLIFEQKTISVYRSLGEQLPIASTANIVSLNANADVGKLLTRLYGKGGKNEQGEVVDITSANITGLPYVENYSYFLALGYTEKYIKDNPSLFIREGIYKNEDVLDANILLKETQDHLLRYCKPSMTCNLKLSMPDSASCDAVKLNMRRDVYNEQTKESIPCRITSITQELNDELTLNLVLESNFTYGSYASNIITKLDKIQAEWSDTWDEYMEGVIKDATDLIKNGINGYVVVNKNEILIMDTDNKETAVNVWRWNSGGLGFSSNGYNGTYSTAMTKDGKIVADMITAGVMNAKIIKAGVLQSLNNKTWVNMEDGTFSFYDKIKFDGTTFTIKLNSGNTVENEIDTAIDRYKQTVDKEFDDVRKKVDGLGDTLTDSFKDGIIGEAEAIAIEQQLKNLDVEKKDIDSIYTTLYVNTDLTGTAKTNLYNAKNSYNTAHSSLIDAINSAISDRKITNIEKSNVQSAFANYGTALANFSKACEEASNAIAEKKKQDVINYTDTQFNILDGKIQSKITSQEAQSIAQQTVNGFKQEVVQTYPTNESVSNAFSDLDENLQNNYATKTLVAQTADSITQTVSKKVGKDEIISSINQTAESVKISASKFEIDGTTLLNGQMKMLPIEGSTNYASLYAIRNGNGVNMRVQLGGTQQDGCFEIVSGSEAKYFWVNYQGAHSSNYHYFHTDSSSVGYNVDCLLENGSFHPMVDNKGYLGTQRYYWNQSWITNMYSRTLTTSSDVAIGGDINLTGSLIAKYGNIEGLYIGSYGNIMANGTIKGSYLESTGNAKIASNLQVDNTATIKSTVYIGGSLEVKSYGTTLKELEVTSTTTLKGYTVIKNNNLGVEGFIYCSGNIEALQSGRGQINCNYLGSMGDVACRGTLSGSNLSISGSKNCVQETESYGKRLVNAYETADYYFGDIGESKLEDGECVVFIDDVFKEIINLDYEYQVFLTKYGRGDIWVAERNKDCFVVQGENDISFGWEIKGKRKGYETNRLEEYKEVDNFVQKDNTI